MEAEKIIIIGGGPAGLAAAIYAGRAFLRPLVIAGSPPGGQLMLTSDVENYPGFNSILGPKLIEDMRVHAEKFGARFENENISKVALEGRPFKFFSSTGKEYASQSIIIASGASAMWLGLESEKRLIGRGVSACATCDGFFFKGKEVAVIGGGDSAMEEALTLTKFASKVYVVYRGAAFRASKIMQKQVLKHSKIEVLWNSEVEEVLGQDKVEGIRLGGKAPKTRELKVEGVFVAIGHKPNTEFLKESNVLLDKKGYIQTAAWYLWKKARGMASLEKEKLFDFRFQHQTSVKGVFAAGDVVDFRYRQAATAVGMGVAAALDIEQFINGL